METQAHNRMVKYAETMAVHVPLDDCFGVAQQFWSLYAILIHFYPFPLPVGDVTVYNTSHKAACKAVKMCLKQTHTQHISLKYGGNIIYALDISTGDNCTWW